MRAHESGGNWRMQLDAMPAVTPSWNISWPCDCTMAPKLFTSCVTLRFASAGMLELATPDFMTAMRSGSDSGLRLWRTAAGGLPTTDCTGLRTGAGFLGVFVAGLAIAEIKHAAG